MDIDDNNDNKKYNNNSNNSNNKYHFTPLILAYLWNEQEILDYLIDNGFPVNDIDQYGYSLLHYMVLRDDLDQVRRLMARMEVDVNFIVNTLN